MLQRKIVHYYIILILSIIPTLVDTFFRPFDAETNISIYVTPELKYRCYLKWIISLNVYLKNTFMIIAVAEGCLFLDIG